MKFLFNRRLFLIFTFFVGLTGAGCIEIQEDTSGMRTESLPPIVSGCGDRVCDEIEQQTGRCPKDCPEDLGAETDSTTTKTYIPLN